MVKTTSMKGKAPKRVDIEKEIDTFLQGVFIENVFSVRLILNMLDMTIYWRGPYVTIKYALAQTGEEDFESTINTNAASTKFIWHNKKGDKIEVSSFIEAVLLARKYIEEGLEKQSPIKVPVTTKPNTKPKKKVKV